MLLVPTVVFPNNFNCQGQTQHLVKLRSPEGVIASSVTYETKCGSPSAPYIIEGQPGQSISFTLLDFSYYERQNQRLTPGSDGPCEAYATFKESNGKQSTTLCGSRIREKQVYSSLTNRVQVTILTRSDPKYFLLKYHGKWWDLG